MFHSEESHLVWASRSAKSNCQFSIEYVLRIINGLHLYLFIYIRYTSQNIACLCCPSQLRKATIGRLGTYLKKGLIIDLRFDFQNENVNADTDRWPTPYAPSVIHMSPTSYI
jgi:hypothetical protein